MRILAVLLSLVLLAPSGVRAAEVRGQDDPGFRTALALWLSDDDETALPALAALASGGNRAAQVLLAQIDGTVTLQGPWLAGLDRTERNALLRAPGGLSGRSWLQAAAGDTPLARLWLVAQTPDATTQTALALAGTGEHRSARSALMSLFRREAVGFAAIADEPDYPPQMRYLVWREWAGDPAARPRIEAEIAALPPGDPQRARLDGRPVDPGAFDDWLASDPLAAPVREPCAALCPTSVRSCTRAGFELLSSYSDGVAVFASGHGGLLLSGSPTETIIPAEVWNASPRARAALLREPNARASGAQRLVATLAGTDACFAAKLADEIARFGR